MKPCRPNTLVSFLHRFRYDLLLLPYSILLIACVAGALLLIQSCTSA